jgi:predicted membrane protein (TIGR00267 family)
MIMGSAFGLGAAVPILPYLVLSFDIATPVSVVFTAAVLFGIGVVKARWTRHGALRSGLEIVLLAAFAGIAGFLFGNVLPGLLGVAAVAG